MQERKPLILAFTLVNKNCRVAKMLRDNGVDNFRILGIRPDNENFTHVVEMTKGNASSIRIFRSEGCKLCTLLSSKDTILLSAKTKGELMKCQIIVADRQSLRKLVPKLKAFPGFRILTIRSNKPVLTSRQEDILLLALRMGYFDTPRRIKARELAKVIGVSTPTLVELLRRAVRNLVIEHYSYLVKLQDEQ